MKSNLAMLPKIFLDIKKVKQNKRGANMTLFHPFSDTMEYIINDANIRKKPNTNLSLATIFIENVVLLIQCPINNPSSCT